MLAQLTRGPTSVRNLPWLLAMSLPAVMQHLSVLEESGLVRTENAGRASVPAASKRKRSVLPSAGSMSGGSNGSGISIASESTWKH